MSVATKLFWFACKCT